MKNGLYLVGLIVLIILVVLLNQPQTKPAAVAVNTVQPEVLVPMALQRNSVKQQKQALETSSLKDTEVDRIALIWSDGRLQLVPEILFYFEYFLNLRGEKPDEEISRIAISDFYQHYSQPIAKVLEDLFLRYCEYRKALADKMSDADTLLQVDESTLPELEAEVQIRFFSRYEIDALFIAQLMIFNTPTKAAAQFKKYLLYQQRLEEDADSAEAAATEIFGEAAAQRLQQLQQSENEWLARLADYRLQRDAIWVNDGLDDYAKDEAKQLLLQRLFTPHEILRVQVLERHQRLP
ncbi:MAG: hypothetical protein HRU20_02925 [Pseudomonadales bacterium]|nr:hypothetical protein [Pseudomonadales bacterium]